MFRKLFCLLAFAALLVAARFDLSTPGKIVRVGDPRISLDGKSVVISVSRANFTDNRWEAQLVLVDIATKAQRILTPAQRGVSSPRWSPDGGSLAFLANVQGKTQIFVVPASGGEPRQVTKSVTGVQHFAWRPDSKAFAYAAAEEEPKKEGEQRFNRSFEVQNNDYL